MPATQLVVHIPLSLAMVCINCESIYKAGDVGECPACAGSTVVPLVRWLTRETPKETVNLVEFTCMHCDAVENVDAHVDEYSTPASRSCEDCGGLMVPSDTVELERRSLQDLFEQEKR